MQTDLQRSKVSKDAFEDKIANIVKLLNEKADKCSWTRTNLSSYVCKIGDYSILLISHENTFTHLVITENFKELYNSIKSKYATLNEKYAVHNTYLALFNKVKKKTHDRDIEIFKEIMQHLDSL